MSEKQKILIADDEPGITEVFASVLERNNFDVTRAFDGEECLQKARLSNYALVLLDVHMPKLDGYEVIKQLKQMPHLKYTPIVFLSGYNTAPNNIESGYKSGATDYWKKPMATDELEVRVKAILRIAEAERTLREMQEGFTSMIVHDLRGPLGGIVGFAEMLSEEKDKLEPEIGELVGEIGKAAKLMLNLVIDFLEITQLETGESKMYRGQVNLRDTVEVVVLNFSKALQEKSIQVKIDFQELPLLYVDPDRIEKVFNQLLDNALRFTPEGGSISISAAPRSNSVVVKFSDTGVGIPAKDIPMLFDKMRITTPGAKRAGSKTGLGLPICRGIIEAHGGTISAESSEGKGTAFVITLPVQTP
ncbi:MAG: hybrid sensor histidine kinase/response regulator [Bacteroidota bacterium]